MFILLFSLVNFMLTLVAYTGNKILWNSQAAFSSQCLLSWQICHTSVQQKWSSCSLDTLIVIIAELQQCSPSNSFYIYLIPFSRSAHPFMCLWRDSQANTNKQKAQVIHPLMPFMKFIEGKQRSQDIQVSSQHFKHFFSLFNIFIFEVGTSYLIFGKTVLLPRQDQSHKAIQQLMTVHIHSLPPEDQKKDSTECFHVKMMKQVFAVMLKMSLRH